MVASGKEPACQCRRHERCKFPRVGRISWRRAQQPTSVFLPGESHGQRSLAGYSPSVRKESDTTEVTKHACMHARHSQDYWGLAGIRAFLILVYFPSIWISIIYLGNPSPFQTELGFLHGCWKCRMVSFWVNSQWVSGWIRFSSQICHYSEGCSGHRFHFTTAKVVVATDLTATSCFQKHQGLLTWQQYLWNMCCNLISQPLEQISLDANGRKFIRQASEAKIKIRTFLSPSPQTVLGHGPFVFCPLMGLKTGCPNGNWSSVICMQQTLHVNKCLI